ncbi:MAG: hypothetical protein N3G20_05765, partial [Verrucomicrobiae bacterium]|nr:hypothetical protein [Verrucomicrobiae bacterium]
MTRKAYKPDWRPVVVLTIGFACVVEPIASTKPANPSLAKRNGSWSAVKASAKATAARGGNLQDESPSTPRDVPGVRRVEEVVVGGRTLALADAAAAVAVPAVQPPVSAEKVVSQTDGSLERHAKGKTLYSFRAENLDIKVALALFARANNLNIVPDPDVTLSLIHI